MAIIIKRYRNRKLYNTQSKRYITLEEIEGLLKEHEDIKVIENDTGNDITAATLSQIIFEIEKNKSGVFPIDFLQNLVRSSEKRFDNIRRGFFTSLDTPSNFDFEPERRIGKLVADGDLSTLEGSQILQKLISLSPKQENIFDYFDSKVKLFIKDQQLPTREELYALMERLDELSQMVDELSNQKDNSGAARESS
jgi:polyhydroxyalkanoate synthesis repressor PhaR